MKKLNFKKKLAETLELPPELAANSNKVSITDFCELNIINYKSIVEYESNIVRINTKEKLIKLEGESLILKNISDDEITVSGKIISVVFE